MGGLGCGKAEEEENIGVRKEGSKREKKVRPLRTLLVAVKGKGEHNGEYAGDRGDWGS
jgi:hypothetical protein